MSEVVKAAQRFASQRLVVNASGSEIIRRTAMCPTHTRLSSDFLGVTEEGWRFRCREKGGHDFLALPDPRAPKDMASVTKWMVAQRQERLKVMNNG